MLEPDLLAHVGVLVQRERQRRGLRQNGQLSGGDLDGPGGQLRILVALGPDGHLANHADAELGPQPVGPLGHLALAEYDLRHSGGIPEVDEDHPAVIAAAGHPTGQGHRATDVLDAQGAGGVRTNHPGKASRPIPVHGYQVSPVRSPSAARTLVTHSRLSCSPATSSGSRFLAGGLPPGHEPSRSSGKPMQYVHAWLQPRYGLIVQRNGMDE